MDLVASLVNRTVTLVGSSMAIFTFILFFLYPRYASNAIDPVLFQVTLTFIVLVIFVFGFSGFTTMGFSESKRLRENAYYYAEATSSSSWGSLSLPWSRL
jgi:hypothetical protein